MTILLVEDDSTCAAYTEALLTRIGANSTKAETAEEALRALDSPSVIGVLCDLVLATGSGLEIARVARQKGLPVVFVTSTDDDHNLNLMYDYGFVIRKPVRISSLMRAVEYFTKLKVAR